MQEGQKTPLYDWHVAHGAKMVGFAGFDMPIEYLGVLAEHEAVRSAFGIFDVSHMGKIKVTGDAVSWLNGLLTNDLLAIENNKAQYSMLLNDQGGVVDDLLAYRIHETEVWLVPNASNASHVFDILKQHSSADVEITNYHSDYCIFAVQGPQAPNVIAQLGFSSDMQYMSAKWYNSEGSEILICRSGYTGEQGFELIVPNAVAESLWNKVVGLGVQPIGLGARDTLRLEMGYPLHGNDIREDITPIEAGLKWAVSFSKPTFIGKSALVQQQASRKRVALKLKERGVPRGHMKVMNNGQIVGELTSGGYSPSLKQGIALALVDSECNVQSLDIDVRGKLIPAEVVKLPFVSSSAR